MSEPQTLTPAEIPSPSPAEPAAPAARRGRRLYAAWAAVSLLVLAAAGFLGYLAWDDARSRQEAAQQAQRVDDLSRQLGASQAQAEGLGAQLATVRAQNTQLQNQLRSPTLAMWNSCAGPCSIGPGSVRVGSVPDTFQLLITFTSNVPIHSYVFTFHQWTQFDDCGFSVRCVSGAYTAFGPATSLDTTFSDAEGCSGYVWVLQSDSTGTISPNVRVHYQPASQPTGACVSSP